VSDVNEPAASGGEGQRPSGTPPGGEGHLASSASTPTRGAATSAASLLDVYANRIADCGFRSDDAQLAAVAKLDDLRSRLIAAHAAASSSPLRRLLGSLMGNSSAQQPERGLYL
jgi:predicted ATPase